MSESQIREFDKAVAEAYLRGVDDGSEPGNSASTVIHDSARRRRRPRTPWERAKMIERLRPYSEANAAEGRKIREGRQA